MYGSDKYCKLQYLRQGFVRVLNSKPANCWVYALCGREVAVLVNEEKLAGVYKATWDASRFRSGAYFYRLTAGSYTLTRKLLLVK